MPNAVRERECRACPPWTVRCAHLPDGRVLWLKHVSAAPHRGLPVLAAYSVFDGEEIAPCTKYFDICGCGGLELFSWNSNAFTNAFRTDDLPQAHAAFEEREAALERERLRDPEGSQ